MKKKLPQDLLGFIYEMDGTYHEYFAEHVLPYLEKRKVFRVRSNRSDSLSSSISSISSVSLYLVLDENYAKLLNSLTQPTFCSTIYFSTSQPKSEYTNLFELVEIIRHPPSTPIEFCSEIMNWKDFCDQL